MNEDQRRQRTEEFERLGVKWVPCETCGGPTHSTATKRCDGCWEVEHRLRDYLKTTQGQVVVAKALVQAGSDSVVATRLVLVNAVEKWANADCGATEAEEILDCLAKLNDLGSKAMNSKAMEQLSAVIDLATYGKFDRNGEEAGLEKDDVDAIVKVCAAFRIELLPDSPYLPKKKKPKKS